MPENPVNIATLVSYRIYPAKMGGQKGIALFYEYLSRLQPLTMISCADNPDPQINGIRFHALGNRSKFRYINPLLYFRIRRLIRREQITHLILEHPYFGWLGILLKWTCGIKLIIHSHNIEALRFKSIGKWWWGILWNYERLTHRVADLNFFIHDDDKAYALSRFKLRPERCLTITYGFALPGNPETAEKAAARKLVCSTWGIDPGQRLLLFNGTLDYKPNLDALNIILGTLNPLLLAHKELTYKIIICGSKLPPAYNGLKDYADKNIIYAGFVPDIRPYFTGTDIFINPVLDGGGIKTKLVEALGYGLSVVTTQSGATGVAASRCGNKMIITADNDWDGFARALQQVTPGDPTPDSFFEEFYWGNIVARALKAMAGSAAQKN